MRRIEYFLDAAGWSPAPTVPRRFRRVPKSQQKLRPKFSEPLRGCRVTFALEVVRSAAAASDRAGFGRDGSRFDEAPDRLVHLRRSGVRIPSAPPNPQARAGPLIEQVLSLTELCEYLHVSPQTIYDLRSQGRGPRGFRVGRELRFRVSEIEAWLARMESDDEKRHSMGGR